jgi:hypothetical protein
MPPMSTQRKLSSHAGYSEPNAKPVPLIRDTGFLLWAAICRLSP